MYQNIFLSSTPRIITWWRVPGASSRACLGMILIFYRILIGCQLAFLNNVPVHVPWSAEPGKISCFIFIYSNLKLSTNSSKIFLYSSSFSVGAQIRIKYILSLFTTSYRIIISSCMRRIVLFALAPARTALRSVPGRRRGRYLSS